MHGCLWMSIHPDRLEIWFRPEKKAVEIFSDAAQPVCVERIP